MVQKRKAGKTAKPKRAGSITKKKAAKKKVVKKTAAKKTGSAVKAEAQLKPVLPTIGEVTHFFPHVSAAVIKLTDVVKTGDMIQIKGHTTDFKQPIESLQINHVSVNEAKKGEEIGLKVKDRVRIGDIVYKL